VKAFVEPLLRRAWRSSAHSVPALRNRPQQGSGNDSVTSGRDESDALKAEANSAALDNGQSNDDCDLYDPACRRKPKSASAGRSQFSSSEAPSPDR
jgi:hypothetical protein